MCTIKAATLAFAFNLKDAGLRDKIEINWKDLKRN